MKLSPFNNKPFEDIQEVNHIKTGITMIKKVIYSFIFCSATLAAAFFLLQNEFDGGRKPKLEVVTLQEIEESATNGRNIAHEIYEMNQGDCLIRSIIAAGEENHDCTDY